MKHLEKQTIWRLSLLYAVIAGGWVFLSDYLLVLLIPNVEQLSVLQMYKGAAFVVVTSLLLHLLLRRELRKQAQIESQSHERESRLRTLVDSVDDVLYTLDRQQRHTGIYGRQLEKDGLSPDFFLGKTAREVLGDTVAHHHQRANEKALKGENVVYDWSISGPDGVQFYQTSVSPLKDTKGDIVGVVGVGRDITERRQMEMALQQERDFAESLIQTAQIIILVLDREGRIVRFNPYMEEISGYCLDEVQGKDWFTTFLTKQDQTQIQTLFEQAIDNVPTLGNVNPIVTKDGRHLAIEWYDKVLKDSLGDPVGLLAVGRDITEQISAQQMLTQRVQERTRELSTLLEISGKVVSTLELEPLLDLILDQLKNVVDYTNAIIFGLPSQADHFILLASRGTRSQTTTGRLQLSVEGLQASPQLFDHHHPLLNGDIEENPALVAMFRKIVGEEAGDAVPYRSRMAVPLVIKKELVGLLGFSHEEANHYSRHQAELVSAFASQAAVAIENARLYQQERERRQAQEALYRADEELYRYLDTDRVLQALVDVAIDILDVEKSATMIWDERREKLIAHTVRGFRRSLDDPITFDLTEGLVGQAAKSGKMVVVEDVQHHLGVARHITDPERICSFVHVPIKINSKIFGVFNVSYTRPRQFSAQERRLFTALGQRAALAIENARLHEQAQKSAALEERQRLARELHDAVTQNLFSATLITEVLPKLWEKDPEEGHRLLKDLRLLSRGALAEMRTLLLELRPTALAETSLGDLLRQLAEAVMGRKGIPVEVTVEGQDDFLPTDVRLGLYRVAQEALNNVAKHARASQVIVALRYALADVNGDSAPVAELRIKDDGRGFNPTHVSPEHLGLNIMRERAKSIEAMLMIDSKPGEGTLILVKWRGSPE